MITWTGPGWLGFANSGPGWVVIEPGGPAGG